MVFEQTAGKSPVTYDIFYRCQPEKKRSPKRMRWVLLRPVQQCRDAGQRGEWFEDPPSHAMAGPLMTVDTTIIVGGAVFKTDSVSSQG